MSQTLYVTFRGKGFWAFDVISSVFLQRLITEALLRKEMPNHEWLSEAVSAWRVNAVTADLGLYLDDQWSHEQIRAVVELCHAAIQKIEVGGDIPASEVTAEPMVDGQYIFPRGIDPIPHRAVARLGYALILLLEETFPEPPSGHAWMYSVEPRAYLIPVQIERGEISEDSS